MLYDLVIVWLVLNIVITFILGIKYFRERRYDKSTRLTCPHCGYNSSIRSFKKGR